jgi:hypothetical protein
MSTPDRLPFVLLPTRPPSPKDRSSVNAMFARTLAVAVAFLLVTFLVLNSSRAAFSSTTDSPTNAVSTASVALNDNDAGSAMFAAVADLVPGSTIDRCIDVTYAGSIDPGAVVMYMPTAPSGTLPPFLDLTIEIGADTADPFASCATFTPTSTLFTGTLDSFRTAHPDYATGQTTWDPAGPSTQTFRFRITVQDNNLAQGLTTAFGFTWEVRSP